MQNLGTSLDQLEMATTTDSSMTTLIRNRPNSGTLCTEVPQYSLNELSDHCDVTSCWIAINDKVYDVTPFMSLHPGGLEVLLEHAGRDATQDFQDKGHSDVAHTMLSGYCIGELTQSDRRKKISNR